MDGGKIACLSAFCQIRHKPSHFAKASVAQPLRYSGNACRHDANAASARDNAAIPRLGFMEPSRGPDATGEPEP
jgi:hypothetical protein